MADTQEDSSGNSHHDLQVIDSMLFHEYAIVNKVIVKVTAWLPPSWSPALPGFYQGLIRRKSGEKVIRGFHWDGKRWTNVKTGHRKRQDFYWRGLAEDPNAE